MSAVDLTYYGGLRPDQRECEYCKPFKHYCLPSDRREDTTSAFDVLPADLFPEIARFLPTSRELEHFAAQSSTLELEFEPRLAPIRDERMFAEWRRDVEVVKNWVKTSKVCIPICATLATASTIVVTAITAKAVAGTVFGEKTVPIGILATTIGSTAAMFEGHFKNALMVVMASVLIANSGAIIHHYFFNNDPKLMDNDKAGLALSVGVLVENEIIYGLEPIFKKLSVNQQCLWLGIFVGNVLASVYNMVSSSAPS